MEADSSAFIQDSFMEPQKGIWLRKRRRRNSDAASVCSLDITLTSEPDNKRKRGLSKVASLANLLATPIRPVMKIRASLQRSFSGKHTESPCKTGSPLSSPCNFLRRSRGILRTSANNPQQEAATPPLSKQRLTRSWSQTIARNSVMELGLKEIKRQEAIYELWSGEDGIVEDLELVQSLYRTPLVQRHLLSEEEAQCIFGEMDDLLRIHRCLRDRLASLRNTAGVIESFGNTFLDWIPDLKCYINHCSNQVWARALLEEKNSNKRFQEFLKRCLESSCSRKLDLWTFLDVPRSRLMKYPLLIGEILRHTPDNHEDVIPLSKAASALTVVLRQADVATGAAECRLLRARLHFPDGHPSMELVDKSTAVVCSGELKDSRGVKFHCFLFNTCFVVTRACRSPIKFTVCFPVIPAEQINAEKIDLIRRSTGIQIPRTGQPAFRVGFSDISHGAHRIFVTSDEHVRKHWMDSLKQVAHSILVKENVTKDSFSDDAKEKLEFTRSRRQDMNKDSESSSNFLQSRPFRQQNRIKKNKMNDNLI